MDTKEFCETHGITATVKWSDSNPNMDLHDMNHYRVTLKMGKARMTVPFSTGYGWTREPNVSDVLDCLLSDTSGMYSNFAEWARDYGYDSDSRKALKIYNTVQEQTRKLQAFLEDLFEEAMNCERM